MTKINPSANSGVYGSTGYEFQKHCALYVLFENYSNLKDSKYFICLEHHEDFLFCHLTQNDLIKSIDTYQAKKASADWGMNTELYEIIHKMTDVGLNLIADTMPKDVTYDHSLNFVSNKKISLSNNLKGKNRKNNVIGPAQNILSYINLDPEISNLIENQINTLTTNKIENIGQLDKLAFGYFDLPQTNAKQVLLLRSMFGDIFGIRVVDHTAAVDTLLKLFRDVENTLNQGNIIRLMDTKKRVDYNSINEAINIITTQQKAYTTWKSKADEISNKLLINLAEKTSFELAFKNSFDLFKDIKQAEHQKILKFVKDNVAIFSKHTSDVPCIEELHSEFLKSNFSQLSGLNIKATIFAAYIETLETI